MGLSSRQSIYARDCDGADLRHDRKNTRRQWFGGIRQILFGSLIWLTAASFADCEPLRIATYNVELTDQGPGLVLQSLQRADDPKVIALVTVIKKLNADILLLTGIDYDFEQRTLGALAANLEQAGLSYPYQLALRPNTGIATAFDLDGNGRFGEPRDAMAYGRYAGAAGMAILSRHPIDAAHMRDFTAFLWADLPRNLMQDPAPVRAIQQLSTAGHFEVPVSLPNGMSIRLLAYYATPPVFDGREDRNGRRNHDETAFWLRLLNNELPFEPPKAPFVLLGQPNLDPADGEGRAQAIRDLLAHPDLQDLGPRGENQRADVDHKGDAAMDTAFYDGIGGLRVEQVLPSRDIQVIAAGLMWPPDSDPLTSILAAASRHHPVWVDVILP